MTRTSLFFCGLLAAAATTACGDNDRQPLPVVDCSVADAYEFQDISNFQSGDSGWFLYADATPGGIPDPSKSSNVALTTVAAPGRCGSTGMVELQASGHNFYGTGFGDWAHNQKDTAAVGTGFEGISFWARNPGNTDKTFMLYVDDGQTIALPSTGSSEDEDRNGDGIIGAGDVVGGTRCRLPPDEKIGRAACYYGEDLPPSSPTRVPEPDECGNRFHTYVTTTENWQLYLFPWSQLVQFPCPNRLEGGIDPADIRKFEIKFVQGTTYDVWLDDIAFYRRRPAAGG